MKHSTTAITRTDAIVFDIETLAKDLSMQYGWLWRFTSPRAHEVFCTHLVRGVINTWIDENQAWEKHALRNLYKFVDPDSLYSGFSPVYAKQTYFEVLDENLPIWEQIASANSCEIIDVMELHWVDVKTCVANYLKDVRPFLAEFKWCEYHFIPKYPDNENVYVLMRGEDVRVTFFEYAATRHADKMAEDDREDPAWQSMRDIEAQEKKKETFRQTLVQQGKLMDAIMGMRQGSPGF